MPALNQVTTANTFGEWRQSTNVLIDERNQFKGFVAGRQNGRFANVEFVNVVGNNLRANTSLIVSGYTVDGVATAAETVTGTANTKLLTVHRAAAVYATKAYAAANSYVNAQVATKLAVSNAIATYATITSLNTKLAVANAVALYATKAYAASNTYVNAVFATKAYSAANSYVNTEVAKKLAVSNAAALYATIASVNTKLAVSNAAATYATITTVNTKLAVSNAAAIYATKAYAASNTYVNVEIAKKLAVSNAVATYATIVTVNTKLAVSNAAATYATITNLNTKLAVANATAIYATKAYAASNTYVNSTFAASSAIVGQQTIWVPAGAMKSTTTAGAAAVASLETTTNDIMMTYLAYDSASTEKAQFAIQMPKGWNEGTIIAQFVWTHPSTTTNFGVRWGIRAVALANDDAFDSAFGTEQEVSDTGGTTHDVYISDETSAMTVAGSPAAEELVIFEVYRDHLDAADTMAVDAWLIGVKIHYTTDAAKDD